MSKTSENERLDQLLVSLGHFASRSRARDAIARGTVKVDGKVVTKPAQTVSVEAEIVVDDPASTYVSRAALKLLEDQDRDYAYVVNPRKRYLGVVSSQSLRDALHGHPGPCAQTGSRRPTRAWPAPGHWPSPGAPPERLALQSPA